MNILGAEVNIIAPKTLMPEGIDNEVLSRLQI